MSQPSYDRYVDLYLTYYSSCRTDNTGNYTNNSTTDAQYDLRSYGLHEDEVCVGFRPIHILTPSSLNTNSHPGETGITIYIEYNEDAQDKTAIQTRFYNDNEDFTFDDFNVNITEPSSANNSTGSIVTTYNGGGVLNGHTCYLVLSPDFAKMFGWWDEGNTKPISQTGLSGLPTSVRRDWIHVSTIVVAGATTTATHTSPYRIGPLPSIFHLNFRIEPFPATLLLRKADGSPTYAHFVATGSSANRRFQGQPDDYMFPYGQEVELYRGLRVTVLDAFGQVIDWQNNVIELYLRLYLKKKNSVPCAMILK